MDWGSAILAGRAIAFGKGLTGGHRVRNVRGEEADRPPLEDPDADDQYFRAFSGTG